MTKLLKIMSDVMFTTQLLWLMSKFDQTQLVLLASNSSQNWVLDNNVWDRVNGQGEWFWHWHVCAEPITWSVGYDEKFWTLIFLFQFCNTSIVIMTGVSPQPRRGIMTMKKPSTNAGKCRRYICVTGSEGSTPSADEEDCQSSQDSIANYPQWRCCWWWQFFLSPSIGLSVVLYRLAMWKWGAGKNVVFFFFFLKLYRYND